VEMNGPVAGGTWPLQRISGPAAAGPEALTLIDLSINRVLETRENSTPESNGF